MHGMAFHRGQALIIGGVKEPDAPTEGNPPPEEELSRVISAYNPETNTWTEKIKALPTRLASFACALNNDDLYIVGGLTPAGFSDCVYRVDLEAKKSKQVYIKKFTEDYPDFKAVEQFIASTCSLTEDKKHILCFGGSTYESETNATFAVDLIKFKELEEEITKNLVM